LLLLPVSPTALLIFSFSRQPYSSSLSALLLSHLLLLDLFITVLRCTMPAMDPIDCRLSEMKKGLRV
jgi:hypothetical protein